MKKVVCVKPLEEFKVYLEFSDGTTGTVDLSEYNGKGVFSIWEDYRLFKQVSIGSSGELIWGDTADLCPDALYMRLKKIRPEDVFPHLCREPSHA